MAAESGRDWTGSVRSGVSEADADLEPHPPARRDAAAWDAVNSGRQSAPGVQVVRVRSSRDDSGSCDRLWTLPGPLAQLAELRTFNP